MMLISWVKENLAIPIGMSLVTALCSTGYVLTEVGAIQYHTLRSMYKDGSINFKKQLTTDIAHGSISHWQYTDLVRAYWVDSGALTIERDATTTTDDERQALLKQINVKPE
ncbi:MAG TPA: hypothetical protein VIE65_07005 [Methylobacter sp.]|jgi:hypothetical protein